jgi:hypothetical protein
MLILSAAAAAITEISNGESEQCRSLGKSRWWEVGSIFLVSLVQRETVT